MKHHYYKLSFVFLFGLAFSGLHAQNMYVRNTSGAQMVYLVTNINKLTFSSGNLLVNITSGTDSYSLSNLRYLNFNDATLSVERPLQKSQPFLVYPNPVKDVLHLSIGDSLESLTHIEIISIEGRVMQQKDLNLNNQLSSINVSELPLGLYFCKLSNATNTQTIKFIKQ